MTNVTLFRALFALTVITSVGAVLVSSVHLPSVVASNFGRGGYATSYGDPATYRMLLAGLAGIVPILVYLGTCWLPRWTGFRTLPHRAFWLSPERRALTWAWIEKFSLVTSSLVGGFVFFLHASILHANTLNPPRMTASTSGFLLGAWLVFIAVSVLLFHRRFAISPRSAR